MIKYFKGSYQPDFEIGFNIDANYKNFDFSVQFYGVSGNTIYNGQKQYAYSTKRHRDLVYSWTDENPTSNIPTPRSNIEHPNVQTSTDYFLGRWLLFKSSKYYPWLLFTEQIT